MSVLVIANMQSGLIDGLLKNESNGLVWDYGSLMVVYLLVRLQKGEKRKEGY